MNEPKIEKRTLYFTMVRHPSSGWIRVGKPFSKKETARGWLSFVKGAWRGLPVKISQMTCTLVDGEIDEKSKQILDEKFNMDPPQKKNDPETTAADDAEAT